MAADKKAPTASNAACAAANGSTRRAIRHGGALSRALHELRADPGRAAQQPADHRHRPDRQRPVALQPPPSRPRRAACATASATPAASRSSSRSIPSRRPASGRPRRSTATSPISAWSRCLYGYFFDGVVLTTGCDKTTPAMIMGACTVNIPAIVLSGGPMLDGHFAGGLAGSGTIVWYARQELAGGPDRPEAVHRNGWPSSAPSVGHCNTMGTALVDEQHGRGARPVAARLRRHSRALPRARPDGLRDRQAHRRHGVGGPEAVRHPDPQGVRERHRGGERARRLDQLPAARQRHRAPYRRRSSTTPTGTRSATTSRCW